MSVVATVDVGEPVPLDELGLDEIESGIYENTFDNRRALMSAGWLWRVYDGPLPDRYLEDDGSEPDPRPMLIEPYSPMERAAAMWEKRQQLLANPEDLNSDYVFGEELMLMVSAAGRSRLRVEGVPGWVAAMTRARIKLLTEENRINDLYEDRGDGTGAGVYVPVRCRFIKSDGSRCWQWSSHLVNSPPMCKSHVRYKRDPGEAQRVVREAKERLAQAAGGAVETLEQLMLTSESEPVRLKASTEILDRAGVRGGIEVDQTVTVEHIDPAAQVRERLERLAGRLTRVDSLEAAAPGGDSVADEQAEPAGEPVDAEIVDEEAPDE
jgi:hypothetical protein